jgi:hypothetical protein
LPMKLLLPIKRYSLAIGRPKCHLPWAPRSGG